MHSGPIILLEFNELTPRLMERFIGEGRLPAFERLRRESLVFTTESDENAPNLEPWIQWVTVHTGMPYAEHGVFHLGDGHALAEKRIWDLVSDRGGKVWVCGSMNIQYRTPIRGWILTDPWTTKVEPHPAAELVPYWRFVSANVLEHTRDEVSLTVGEKLAFVRFMACHGLSAESVLAIAGQLSSERLASAASRWKRTVILDKLQFDLFRWVYRRERPDLSTFFVNSTAHFQHVYWRNLEPERFRVKPTRDEQAAHESAILYGYQQMDRLLDRFLLLAGEHATLVFCTALSQQPCLAYEEDGGKRMYRPRDFLRFLGESGIASAARVSPVMAHEFQIDLENEQAARDAEARLGALRYADRAAMAIVRDGRRIVAGCQVHESVPAGALLTVAGPDRSIPFFDLFYGVEGMKSGMHHPDGMLWIRTPSRQHAVHSGKVPLVSVAPTLLRMLDVPRPAFMKGEPVVSGLECAA